MVSSYDLPDAAQDYVQKSAYLETSWRYQQQGNTKLQSAIQANQITTESLEFYSEQHHLFDGVNHIERHQSIFVHGKHLKLYWVILFPNDAFLLPN